MTRIAAVVAAVLVVGWITWRLLRWWRHRARIDPRRDPGAARVGPAHEADLARALAGGTPAEIVAGALVACRVAPDLHWRAGLRRVVDQLPLLPEDAEGDALRAEVHLALGEVAAARALVLRLPADHWRACVVRAGLYAVDRDLDRADSALVAALMLAPPAEQPAIRARLTDHRRRHPRGRSPHLTLWERPP